MHNYKNKRKLIHLLNCRKTKKKSFSPDKMTSGIFFDCCKIGYEANNYHIKNYTTNSISILQLNK
jgi:hypothetical protein